MCVAVRRAVDAERHASGQLPARIPMLLAGVAGVFVWAPGWRRSGTSAGLCCLGVGAGVPVVGAVLTGVRLWEKREYAAFFDFHDARTELMDYHPQALDSVSQETLGCAGVGRIRGGAGAPMVFHG